jgi:large subunit ribosomal protein L29
MRMETIRDLTRDELLQKREELQQELFNLRMRRSLRELDNPLKVRILRRDIARIETILSEDRLNIRSIVDQSGSLLDQAKDKPEDTK